MPKVVWVLGSGFSRSLGGPLLADLFTVGSRLKRNTFFPSENYPLLHDRLCQLALSMYDNCLPGNRARVDAWTNPEEFLDTLDTAASLGPDSPIWKHTVTNLLSRASSGGIRKEHADLSKLAAATRRLLAADCSAFLVDNDPHVGEKWQPYLKWFKTLKHSDTILTFNYDLVLETLATSTGSPITVALPNDQPPSKRTGPAVFKMHGSVDWRIESEGFFSRSNNPTFALAAADDQPAIAAPGPTKSTTVKKFEILWRNAERSLKRAEAIVFVGYRFLPTDAEARGRLLDAVSQNNTGNLQLRIILGPDTNSDDSRRLTSLLRYASPNKKPDAIVSESLWAEDFLDRYDPSLFHIPEPQVRFL